MFGSAAAIHIICGIAGAFVAGSKGRSGCFWFTLAFVLGPIGLILALIMPRREIVLETTWSVKSDGMKKCPYCAEFIQPEAIVCRYCGRDLPNMGTSPRWDPANPFRCPRCGRDSVQTDSYGRPFCSECRVNVD